MALLLLIGIVVVVIAAVVVAASSRKDSPVGSMVQPHPGFSRLTPEVAQDGELRTR